MITIYFNYIFSLNILTNKHPTEQTNNNQSLYFCPMLIIQRTSTDPFVNLATEEYLVKNIEEPCFMLWRNTPAVIIGKHQNPLKEVNLTYIQEHQIPVIRRISGGGTVYHDLGNINYSFIDFGKTESLVNFAKYSSPILQLLQKMDIDAQLVGKSDLRINGLKFSGNASHVHRNRVLHHGTLLFDSNLNILSDSIKITHDRIIDKSVPSNRSQVCNIKDHLQKPLTTMEFMNLLIAHIQDVFPDAQKTKLTEAQERKIQKLVEEKYHKWEWNYAYSPKYQITSEFLFNQQQISSKCLIERGLIKNIQLSQPLPAEHQKALDSIIGQQHEKKFISSFIEQHPYTKSLQIVKSILF